MGGSLQCDLSFATFHIGDKVIKVNKEPRLTHMIEKNISYYGVMSTTKTLMVRSLSRYATNLYGNTLMVLIKRTSLESKAQNIPCLISTFKMRDSLILKGIMVFEALESIIQFLTIFPFTIS